MSMTRLELFDNLGYKKDPFVGHRFKTGDSLRVERIVKMAVESRAMVNIIGPRGIGKSDAVDPVLEKLRVKVVRVEKIDKENLTIADIRTAMILDLSQEQIKRGGEISSRQLRRIVGEAVVTNKQTVVLVIEEGQRLHPNTLRSLKSLRELKWLGQSELFTIVIVSQSNPMARPGVSEVALRSDAVYMKGLSPEEAEGYLRVTVGTHFDEAALAAMAELPAGRNYLELQALAVEMLNIALAEGRDVVTLEDVQGVASLQGQALPRVPGRAKAADVSGKSALASVLGKGAAELKGAANA